MRKARRTTSGRTKEKIEGKTTGKTREKMKKKALEPV